MNDNVKGNGKSKAARIYSFGFPEKSEWNKGAHLVDPFEDVSFPINGYSQYFSVGTAICEIGLADENLLEFITEKKYDIGAISVFDYCGFGLFAKARIPSIATFNAFPMLPIQAITSGLPNIASHTAPLFYPHDLSTLNGKLWNMIYWAYTNYIEIPQLLRKQSALFHQRFGEEIDVEEARSRVDVNFINSNEIMEKPRAIDHRIQYVGGINLRSPKPISGDLEKLMSRSKNGTVIFSFGTQVPAKAYPRSAVRNFVKVFQKFSGYTFLWKYNVQKGEEDIFEEAKNVFPLDWLPQTDLLYDKRVVAFITHAGLNSFLESSYAGKPMIAIPLFADQPHNAKNVDKFYKDLKKVYTRLSKWDSSIIICGDFNAVVGCSSDDLPFVGGHGTGQRSDNGDRLVNFAFSSRVSILNTIYPKRPNRKWTWISPNGKTKNEIDFILTNRREIAVDCEVYCDYLNCSDHRLLRARFRSTAKKEKSRKFAKAKRAGGERSWDPVRFKNTITEMLTENPPTCYEELTESIRSAASTATHATHQLSRISEATKKMMMSRFQMIHAGQTKNADLAKINNEVRRSLENDLDKWREVKSLEAASPQKTRIRLLTTTVIPAMTYGCETWTSKEADTKRLQRAVSNMFEIAGCDPPDMEKQVLRRKLKWAGHVSRMKYDRWAKIVSEWDPRGSARPRGRPPKRWADDIKDSIKIFIHNEALRGNLGHGRRRIGILEARRAWSTVGRDRVTWRSLDLVISRMNDNVKGNGKSKAERIYSFGFPEKSPWNKGTHLVDPFQEASFPVNGFRQYHSVGTAICEIALADENLLSFITDKKYDIGAISVFDYCGIGLFAKIGIPSITSFNALPILPIQSVTNGLPNIASQTAPTFYPHDLSTLYGKLWNMIYWAHANYIEIPQLRREQSALFYQRFGGEINVEEAWSRVDVNFINSNEIMEKPRAIDHRIQYVGGINLRSPKPIDGDLEKLLSRSKNGTVIFSFGTQVPAKAYPRSAVRNFVKVFEKFSGYTFLWKYDVQKGEEEIFKRAKNVFPLDWLPQTDLLYDKRVVAFITHAGLNSFLESSYAGKPMIAIPLFADQPHNAQNGVSRGTTYLLNKVKLSEESIEAALRAVLFDESYSQNAKTISKMLAEKPAQPKDRFVEWMEYAIANPGLHKVLEHPGAKMGIFEYYCLDVDLIISRLNDNVKGNGKSKAERIYSFGFPERSAWNKATHLVDPFEDASFPINGYRLYHSVGTDICEIALADEKLLSFITEKKYDIGAVTVLDYCGVGLFVNAEIPSIATFSALPMLPIQSVTNGFSNLPSQTAPLFYPHDLSTLNGKLWNMIYWSYMNYIEIPQLIREQNALFNQRFGRKIDVEEAWSRVDVSFINSNELIEKPQAIDHRFQYVGGINLKFPKPIGDDFEKLLSISKNGTVIFSFGTQVPAKAYPKYAVKNFVKAFKKFPDYTFLWKYDMPKEEEDIFKEANNVFLLDWLPQTDLLYDKRVVAFITHAGLNSFLESSYAGKPMIAIPLFADQPHNAQNGVSRGTTYLLNKVKLSEESIEAALRAVFFDGSYSQNAKKLSKMLAEKPDQPKDRFVEWMEYAIANPGLHKVLEHPGAKMGVFEYYCLDVILLIVTMALTVTYLLYKFLNILLDLVIVRVNDKVVGNGRNRAERVYSVEFPTASPWANALHLADPFGERKFFYGDFRHWFDIGHQFCEIAVNDDKLLEFIGSKKYDIAITTEFDYCPLGVVSLFDIPAIATSNPVPIQALQAVMTGIPNPPATIVPLFQKADLTTFIGKFWNVINWAYIYYVQNPEVKRVQENILRQRFGSEFSMDRAISKIDLAFINSNEIMEKPRALNHRIQYIGGINMNLPKSLNEDFSQLLSRSQNGTVIFSFGTQVPGKSYPRYAVKNFVKVFKKFPGYTFLWKYDVQKGEEEMFEKAKNVFPIDWLPQTDLLYDTRVIGFISHVGLNSFNEASYAGKPILAIPLFADQPHNADNGVLRGTTYKLDKTELTEKSIEQGLRAILFDPIYQQNAKTLQKMLNSKPVQPKDRFVEWIEFAAENPGLHKIFALPGANMGMIEFFCLDAIFYVVFLSVSLAWLTVKVGRVVFKQFVFRVSLMEKSQ
uniref:glucuronosyltransferase n=1 Tax=Caenorhabditis japonica TaxID=281687 RepID=A0A8R1DH33_CAEJA